MLSYMIYTKSLNFKELFESPTENYDHALTIYRACSLSNELNVILCNGEWILVEDGFFEFEINEILQWN